MMKSTRWAARIAGSLIALGCVGAQAASYDFQLQYEGGNVASLLPGSDAVAGTFLDAGDSFSYSLQAQSGWQWEVGATDGYFAVFALGVTGQAIRIGDFTLTLFQGGSAVASFGEDDIDTSYVHIGTNTIDLVAGTAFDSFTLTYVLDSAEAVDDDRNPLGIPATTEFTGDLPIFGAPEFADAAISYSPVPEPGALAMMFAGLAAVGAIVRRRKR